VNAAQSREPIVYEPQPAIRVGTTSREQVETRWGLILVVFMRLLAALWILQGLVQWASFLLPHEALFDHLPMTQSGAIIFFAVIDLMAAVGLWLATPWGGVLWLLAALSQIIAALTIGHTFNALWIGADGVLILLYFALTWQAGRFSPE
jgi:Family of unknown function (DUF6163)